MPILLTDAEISALVKEQKLLPANYSEKIQLKSKRGHKERELELKGYNGSEFRLILRLSQFNEPLAKFPAAASALVARLISLDLRGKKSLLHR